MNMNPYIYLYIKPFFFLYVSLRSQTYCELLILPLSLEGWDYTGVCQYPQVYGMLGIEPY